METEDAKTVAPDESDARVDGFLGLSCLGHFDFRIDRRHPDKLIRKAKLPIAWGVPRH